MFYPFIAWVVTLIAKSISLTSKLNFLRQLRSGMRNFWFIVCTHTARQIDTVGLLCGWHNATR